LFLYFSGALFVPMSVNIPEANCLLPQQVDPRLREVWPTLRKNIKTSCECFENCLFLLNIFPEKHVSLRRQRNQRTRNCRLRSSFECRSRRDYAFFHFTSEKTMRVPSFSSQAAAILSFNLAHFLSQPSKLHLKARTRSANTTLQKMRMVRFFSVRI
jgi:hypothetical protein